MSNRAERRRKERAKARAADRNASGPGRSGRDAGTGGSTATYESIPAPRVAVLAVALALVAGLVEVGVVAYLERIGLIVRLSPHYPWMIPLAHLLTFLAITGVLLAVRRVWRRAGTGAVTLGILLGLTTFAVVGVVDTLHPAAVAVLALGVGVQTGRMAGGRLGGGLYRGAAPVAAVLGVALVVVAVVSFVGPRRAEAGALEGNGAVAAETSRPNVLLVVMDAVRARSMGLYNPTLRNTPVLSTLAAQSVVFDRAYAPSPWTLPTHATLFTGRWPTEHQADWKVRLDDRFPTLAERLTAAGYATGGFTANMAFTGPEQGVDRGFGRYQAHPVDLGQIVLSTSLGRHLADLEVPRRWLGLEMPLNEVPAPEITDRFLRWRARHPDRPFFAFLNYYDAHEPFPPAPGGPPITPLSYRHSLLSGVVTHFEAPDPLGQDRFLRGYLAGYRAAIGEVDREIRRLLGALAERGELDNTIVVITSDHGEVIGEHRLVGHNSSLYHPNLWVPLLIRYPGAVPAGLRLSQEVTLRHVPATILALAGVENTTGIPGRSLAALWGRGSTDESPDGDAAGPGVAGASGPDRPAVAWNDTLFSHLTGGEGFPPWAPAALGPEMHSLVRDRHHYILNGDGSEELYDLRSDPGELRNLAGDSAAATVRADLRAVVRSVAGTAPLPGGR